MGNSGTKPVKSQLPSEPDGTTSPVISSLPPDPVLEARYCEAMKSLRLNSVQFKDAQGHWLLPYSFRKQADALPAQSNALSLRAKRIQREVQTLAEQLPLSLSSSIFVAVDDNRPDLIKALISGPQDTPYENGLFEFDIFFPEHYPHKPPQVAFVTTGNGKVRFNPNLYANGYVCLSVINTWSGKAEEQWNPYLSVHKVLLAIQAFVFVKEPFYNEPGMEKLANRDWSKRCSDQYNARVRHATLLHAMLNQLQKPPAAFAAVVRTHLLLKRQQIELQIQRWLSLLPKNSAVDDDASSDDGNDAVESSGSPDASSASSAEATASTIDAKQPPSPAASKGTSWLQKLLPLNSVLNSVVPMGGISSEGVHATAEQLLAKLSNQSS